VPTALSDEELDALIERFDALVGRSLRRAIKAGTSEALTAAAVAGPPQVDSTTGEPHTGAMIALVPKDPEKWMLPYPNVEGYESLHVTLAYLGETDDIPDHILAALSGSILRLADHTPNIEGTVFGVSIWNAQSDTPSLNMSVGGEALEYMHDYVRRLLFNLDEDFDWEPPEQHTPWVAHMCLAYGEPAKLKELFDEVASREGPIIFDRIRVAFGGEASDYLFA
jgi:2'-5' RNA ligase